MTTPPPDTPTRPESPVRDNAAWRRYFEHEERMARANGAAREPSYTIEQVAPPGKTGGFAWSVAGPDPDAVAAKALEWAEQFPAPQPVAKS